MFTCARFSLIKIPVCPSLNLMGKYNKKRRNATKPGFQRFNQVLI